MAHRRAMAVSIDVGATEEMLAALGERAVRLAERLEDEDFPRAAVLNLNAPALPPAELKEMRLAPLSDAFYEDGYEKRESPRGQIYFWLEGGTENGTSPSGYGSCAAGGGISHPVRGDGLPG